MDSLRAQVPPGEYSLSISDVTGCRSEVMDITLYENPQIKLLNLDTIIFPGTPLLLDIEGDFEGVDTLFWIRNDGTKICQCQDTLLSNPLEGLYSFMIEGTFAKCYEPLNFSVEYVPSDLYIPSGFSPNGDGQNDKFEVFSSGVVLLSLKIFDRWGGLVYSGEGPTISWDGTSSADPVQPGVYIYQLVYENLVGVQKIESGTTTLIR